MLCVEKVCVFCVGRGGGGVLRGCVSKGCVCRNDVC